MNNYQSRKIAVIGAGFVGSTTAYTLMISGLVSDLVLIDINNDKAEGEIMDMNHGMPFVRPVRMQHGIYSDCTDADIIIISAGANQKHGETRLDLLNKNTAIFKTIISEIKKYNNDCILLVVTNPVDILTYVTWKISGFPKNKVIGSGTVLDTARFKYLLGEHVGIDPRNVHAYIIGEHGDSEVAAWSLTNIAGIPMEAYCSNCNLCDGQLSKYEIYNNVKNAASEIIEKKGATYYAVALAVKRIVEAIIRDENSILTVSGLLEGNYGIDDVCLSLPSVVNGTGISRVLDLPLNEEETALFRKSADTMKSAIKSINL
jgi:L-lactate dehydrogenase